MPIYKTKKEDFFKNWSSEMAYVLGFFAADGSMFVNPRGAHFLDFTSTDGEIIEKIRKILGSNHKIGVYRRCQPNWKTRYRLQMGSREMFEDIEKIGFTPKKTKRLKLPKIPHEYFSDFVRGYFDGDGCLSYGFYKRKNRKKLGFILITRFTCGTKGFLEDLHFYLKQYTGIKKGSVVSKQNGKAFDLQFSIRDSIELYRFMYENSKQGYFLKRKHDAFQKALKIRGRGPIG